MDCEYCGQENADIHVNDHWYHKNCYIRLRSQEKRFTSEDKLIVANCCATILIIIFLIWLFLALQPVL